MGDAYNKLHFSVTQEFLYSSQYIFFTGILLVMRSTRLSAGTIHKTPEYVRVLLLASKDASKTWNDITPLARNEWICWIQQAKKEETKVRRLKIMLDKLVSGERRPCCFAGCIHR